MAERDPLIEVNRRAMEFIWNKVDKEVKDGVEYITYISSDIPYLYQSGLVDTATYSLAQWEKAFEDCRGEDGRYWVSHEKMLALGRFRYCKTVNEPFDPLKMRVGKYSVERLWKLFENSVIPSCSLPYSFMKNTFDQMFRQKKKYSEIWKDSIQKAKEQGQEIDEEEMNSTAPRIETIGGETFIDVTPEQLAGLRQFLDAYPSPRRKLETAVLENRNKKLQELSDIAKNPQKSSFEAGKDFRKTAQKDLKDLLVKTSENPSAGRQPTGEIIDVKSLQNRRPKGF